MQKNHFILNSIQIIFSFLQNNCLSIFTFICFNNLNYFFIFVKIYQFLFNFLQKSILELKFNIFILVIL